MGAAMPDINNLALSQELGLVDENVDPASYFDIPILDDGDHVGTLTAGDRGVKISQQRNKATGKRDGVWFLNVHIQAKAEDGSGSAFDNLTTLLMRGSTGVHAALALAGHRLPNIATAPASFEEEQAKEALEPLKNAIELALQQSPRLTFTTEWEAQVNDGTKEAPQYRTVATKQRNFKKILDPETGMETGKYDPQIQDGKTGQTARAQARIVKYSRA